MHYYGLHIMKKSFTIILLKSKMSISCMFHFEYFFSQISSGNYTFRDTSHASVYFIPDRKRLWKVWWKVFYLMCFNKSLISSKIMIINNICCLRHAFRCQRSWKYLTLINIRSLFSDRQREGWSNEIRPCNSLVVL